MTGKDMGDIGIGGPTTAAWREDALARVEGLTFLERWIDDGRPDSHERSPSEASVGRHLDAAREAAGGAGSNLLVRTWNRVTQSQFERALANLDMAEVDLLRRSDGVLDGAMPSISAHVNRFLPKDDPRRMTVDELTKRAGTKDDRDRSGAAVRIEGQDREGLLNALAAANTQRRRNLARLRSFRNMLRGGIFTAFVLAAATGWIGYTWPQAMPLCFSPESDGNVTLVCPQAAKSLGAPPQNDPDKDIAATVKRGDILLVELLGLLGAALSVAAVLRNLRKGTSTPYNVAFSLAILKLPTGALTAMAGLLLMRADFVPGLSALDSSAQILGWALVFGIAQQLVTRVADNHAQGLLEGVGGNGAAGDRTAARRRPA